ncbi:MAG: DUF3486 family protein [Bacteroidota bacterium]
MPARSKVLSLPNTVKADLDARLVSGGFSDYEGLADWLEGQGFQISKSSLGRYGKAFEARLGALRLASEQAKAIVAEMGDDKGDMGEALTAVAQQKTFELLMDLEVDVGDVQYDKLVTAIAKLNATGVQQKKWRSEVLRKVEAAADEVDTMAQAGGLTDETAEAIRAKILGIAA